MAEVWNFAIRTLIMAAGAGVTLTLMRIKDPAARHRVWTVVLLVMLVSPLWLAWGPKVAIPVPAPTPVAETVTVEPEAPEPTPAAAPIAAPPAAAMQAAPVRQADWTWSQAALALYFTVLVVMLFRHAIGTLQARQLVRSAREIDGVLTTDLTAAPLTAGWFPPAVILPTGWRDWPPERVEAVLIHEREHVHRRDPLVQWLALLNRCLFWFHPLAWWLEGKLGVLAEEACDAAVLRRGYSPQEYSLCLIDIARSVHAAGFRVALPFVRRDALAERVKRITQGSTAPPVSKARGFAAGAVTGTALIAGLACMTVAPGEPSMNELMHRRADRSVGYEEARKARIAEIARMTPEDARALEGKFKADPDDEEAYRKLSLYYERVSDFDARGQLALWLIEHHPDGKTYPGTINPAMDRLRYEQGKRLWLIHVNKPGADANVYLRASEFLERYDKPEAERLLIEGQRRFPDAQPWALRLGRFYAEVLLPMIRPGADARYANIVRERLAASDNAAILAQTANGLTFCGNRNSFCSERLALARRYNNRALELQPDFGTAHRIAVLIDSIESKIHLGNTPPDQWTEADRIAFLLGQLRLASRWDKDAEGNAHLLLKWASKDPHNSDYGTVVFMANQILGFAALKNRHDKREAVRYLEASASGPANEWLRYHSIDMTLARQLVDWGEREAVARFLDHFAKINQPHGKEMAEWAAQIRKGINPDLLPYTT